VRREYQGRVGVPGLALGVLLRVDRVAEPGDGAAVPLDEAVARVAADLAALAARLRADGQPEAADIAETSALIATDPDLRAAIDTAQAQGVPVATAVRDAVDGYAALLAGLGDPTLAGRATDVRAVGRRLLAALAADSPAPSPDPSPAQSSVPSSASEPAAGTNGARLVLVGHEVAADDLLTRAGQLAGVVSVVGGAGAHTAIVARALGVPAVFGVEPALLAEPDAVPVLVDGATGSVVLNPSSAERGAAGAVARERAARAAQLAGERGQPTRTRDGHLVSVYANVASAADNAAARDRAAAGIGLVRTEMPFLTADAWPGYAAHLATLGPLLAGFDRRPVTVRTLDFADDKLPPFLRAGRSGPLGRGLPLLLAEPGAFADQFRAIVAAGAATRLRIMIPMVASVAELLACGELLDGVLDGAPRPPLGAMIELPEAVAHADELARYAGFFSIGSNDLTAALLGLTRRDPALTPLRAAEPVVLQAIAATVAAARPAGVPVSVCGDAAAEPTLIPLLVGLGCDTLSVAPAALDETRALVRGLEFGRCVAAAQAALGAGSLAESAELGAGCLP